MAVDSGERFRAAVKKVQGTPSDDAAWNELEALAAELQRADDVDSLYLKVLKGNLAPDVASRVGQRAVQFHEEWFGADADALSEILGRVLEVDPTVEWAFERLMLSLSVAQRWDELLGLYDRTIAALKDGPRRRRLLQEGAGIAKDFLGRADRAIVFLDELFQAKPADAQVASSLERLLEKQGAWEHLARVWQARLPLLGGAEARELRERAARLYVEKLNAPERALAEARTLLASDGADDTVACELLENILANAATPVDARRQALALLRTQHEKTGREARIVAAVRVALAFAAGDEKIALLREAADRLYRDGDTAAAMEQLVELLGLLPDDAVLRTRLRHLADVSGAQEVFVRGLMAAATATADGSLRVALLLEAAHVEEVIRGDRARAIELYRRVAGDALADDTRKLVVLRRLADLLAAEPADQRLPVLERLADLEQAGARRAVLGEAARLASAAGEVERAVAAWEKRLAADPADREALDGVVDILAGAQRWEPLVAALRRRASAPVTEAQQREDLVRAAGLQRNQLDALPAAIETWEEVCRRFGEDAASTDALGELLIAAERWKELTALYGRAGEADRAKLCQRLAYLGDVARKHHGDAAAAVEWYGRALGIDPAHAAARAGLRTLLDDAAAGGAALRALVRACEETDDWRETLALLPARLKAAADDRARARLHLGAAALFEARAKDAAKAFEHVATALGLAPDERVEAELIRLAGEAEAWESTVEAIGRAATRASAGRAAELRSIEVGLVEERLRDKRKALAIHQAMLKAEPERFSTKAAVVRLAAELGDWTAAVEAALSPPLAPTLVERDLFPLCERGAERQDPPAFRPLADALAVAVSKRPTLPRALARDLELRVVSWYGKAKDPEAAGLAEKALERAVSQDPLHQPTVERLAEAQRAHPGRPLYDTLTRLAALAPTDLDALTEAAEVASETLGDDGLARASLRALLDRATQLLAAGIAPAGRQSAEEAAAQAIDRLVTLLVAGGDRRDARRAVDLLLDGTRLALPADTVRQMRRRAGKIAREALVPGGGSEERALAREIFRRIVDEHPDDREAVRALAALCEEPHLLPELLALKRRQLDASAPLDDRLADRLEIARVAEEIEARTGRLEALLANLEDAPGHAATVAALASLLRARGRQAELADLLTTQARKLEEKGDSPAAARLWGEVAALAEDPLRDPARAVAAHERVAALEPSAATLDALARLYSACNEPAAAAGWLEQRLAMTDGPERLDVSLRLARAYLAAGQRHRAVAGLERALGEHPTAEEARTLLIDLYREARTWEALARALEHRCEHATDPAAILTAAREAAGIYREKLGALDRAVPVLERALVTMPTDRTVRMELAEALRAAGRLPEARGALQPLLEEQGRRRSKERAAVHHLVAEIARAEGQKRLALEHLEHAATMYIDHLGVQLALADVAEESGDLGRAEQAYRALLVLARRADARDAVVSSGEVLLRLRRVAQARGQHDAAAECLDTAVGTAMQSPAEARRLQTALMAGGEPEIALALLEKRRAAASTAADESAVLCELGDALDKVGRTDEALDTALKALERVPESPDAHALARRLGVKLRKADRYLDAILKGLEQRRRWDDGPRVADLLLRAGEVTETDLGEPKRAAAFYARAEQTGTRAVEALTALARTSAAAGDRAEHARAMTRLRRLATEVATPAEQAEILYRLAALDLAAPDGRLSALESLAEALDRAPDFDRALKLVRDANIPDSELPRVMALYERVARASGDERMLLDFLERRAGSPGATNDQVREAVEVALSAGEIARAEALLARAIDLARTRPAGLREATWAVLDLAQRKRAAGDRDAATQILEDARETWGSPRVLAMLRDLARESAQLPGGASLAARLYEDLRAVYPADRDIWQPLIRVYAMLGDRAAMERVVRETAEKLFDRYERNVVRMAWARFLMEQLGDTGADVAAVLREVLADDPGQNEALMLLADLHERRGDVGDAVAVLSEALRASDGRGDAASRAALARRLGDLVKKADPGQAREVYRSALAAPIADAGARRALQASLLELLGDDELAEKAALAEEILAGESGESAAARAVALADLREKLGDAVGARRALELGRKRAPEDAALFARLEREYEAHGRFRELGELLLEEAGRRPTDATSLLRRAARVRRDRLGDAPGAAALLRRAAEQEPGNAELLRELAACLIGMNEWATAVETVTAALARPGLDAVSRLELLRLRAELHGASGDETAALADLEEAFSVGGMAVAAELTDALFRYAARCANEGDVDAERSATFRLAQMVHLRGEGARAQDILLRWVESHPNDHEALRVLRQQFEADGRWDDAAQMCIRLLDVEEAEGKVEAVLGLAYACEKMGNANEAIPLLEGVLEELPGHPAVIDCLVRLHQGTGNFGVAGHLLIQMAEGAVDEASRFKALCDAAEVLLRDGDPSVAFTAAEKAVALRPKDRGARRLLADASLAAGLHPEALEILNALVAESRGAEPTELAGLYHRLARAAGGLGDRPGQLQALKRALDTDRRNGVVAAELADLAEEIGDDDLALRALRAVTLHAPKGPLTPAVAFFRQARIAHKNGDKPRAIIFTKRALQEDPALGEAQQFLDQLR